MSSSSQVFKYKDHTYPCYIRDGNACAFIIPTAEQFCKGEGLDIGGYMKWTFPGARAINITLEDGYDAYNVPEAQSEAGYDYIFSSHTLEHLPNYIQALEYWKSKIRTNGGVLFLYLPHPDMEYWLPQNNRKHLHVFTPTLIKKALEDLGFSTVLTSERDLYWSFAVVGIL
jgi:hypothetical protein